MLALLAFVQTNNDVQVGILWALCLTIVSLTIIGIMFAYSRWFGVNGPGCTTDQYKERNRHEEQMAKIAVERVYGNE